MTPTEAEGLPRHALDDLFKADQARKSNLLIEAELLRQQGKDGPASASLAAAAEIEESLSRRAEALGYSERGQINLFSAASCWAQAGNFYRALTLYDELANADQTPPRLREHAARFAATIRSCRSKWYAELNQRNEEQVA